MSRKGAKTQRDAYWFTLTRWVNADARLFFEARLPGTGNGVRFPLPSFAEHSMTDIPFQPAGTN